MNYSVADHSYWFRNKGSDRFFAESLIERAKLSCDSSSVFWLGYQAAIQTLFAPMLSGQLAALVVNEQRQSSPKYWSTQVTEQSNTLILSGRKDFVTAIDQIDVLIVTAVNKLEEIAVQDNLSSSLVLLPKNIAGLVLKEKSIPILKELDKKSSVFEDIVIAEDQIIGHSIYDDYVKPFRYVEDFYVSLAFSAYLSGLIGAFLEFSDHQNAQHVDLSTLHGDLTDNIKRALECCQQEVVDAFSDKRWPNLKFESWLTTSHALFSEGLKLLAAGLNTAETDDQSKTVYRDLSNKVKCLQADSSIMAIGQKARDIRLKRAKELNN